MPHRDSRVDAYIEKAPAYSKPILKKLRSAIHAGDKSLREDIKWGAPAFVKNGIVCSIRAFKKHSAVWFHKGALLKDPGGLLLPGNTVAMRVVHYTDAKQVAAHPIAALVREAVALDAARPATKKAPKRAAKKATGKKVAKKTAPRRSAR
jgi:hypothetical protein